MKKFKNIETQKLFDFWISQYPESFHPFDMERLYNFVFSMFTDEEYIDEEELFLAFKEKKDWTDEYTRKISTKFAYKIEDILGFLRFLKENNKFH